MDLQVKQDPETGAKKVVAVPSHPQGRFILNYFGGEQTNIVAELEVVGVDDQTLESVVAGEVHPSRFFDVAFDIDEPANLTPRSNQKVRAELGSMASGGVFRLPVESFHEFAPVASPLARPFV